MSFFIWSVIRIIPNHTNTLSNKGVALCFLDRFKEAVVSFNKALEINPNDSNILSNKDLAQSKLNQKMNHALLETEGNKFLN